VKYHLAKILVHEVNIFLLSTLEIVQLQINQLLILLKREMRRNNQGLNFQLEKKQEAWEPQASQGWGKLDH
jgi:hypothetical protein